MTQTTRYWHQPFGQAQSKTRKRAHADVHTTSLLLLLAHKSQTHASPHAFFFLVEIMEKI